jgi:hypothetical protein
VALKFRPSQKSAQPDIRSVQDFRLTTDINGIHLFYIQFCGPGRLERSAGLSLQVVSMIIIAYHHVHFIC